MNKAELVAKVAEKAGMSKKSAAAAVDVVFKTIEEVLKKGENLTIVGFGTFKVVERAARTGRNPQTGEAIEIPAKKVVRFKPGKQLSLA